MPGCDKWDLQKWIAVIKEIFVVEQNCIYQDLDDKDYDSLHVFYEKEGFFICSEEFLEDEIPHVQMELILL